MDSARQVFDAIKKYNRQS